MEIKLRNRAWVRGYVTQPRLSISGGEGVDMELRHEKMQGDTDFIRISLTPNETRQLAEELQSWVQYFDLFYPKASEAEIETQRDYDVEYHECSVCGGQLMLLGTLGKLTHSKCRNCGMEFSKGV